MSANLKVWSGMPNSIMLPTIDDRQAFLNLDFTEDSFETMFLAKGRSSRAFWLLVLFFSAKGSGLPVILFINLSLRVPRCAGTAVDLKSLAKSCRRAEIPLN